ncbi:hypothetical protein GGR92_004983 [Spirosoma lacussanchae]|uniref:hypothetical protein n=1 Tax=Spirosoma lacussanchae TaxID=1884249 RepID=UPI001109DD02|nr:hypothetical protein [Spirosoma lacussanchae]
MKYHQNNLLVSHKRMMWLSVGGLTFLTVALVWSIIWSFARYRQATQYTYVFHRKGAAIAIYDQRTYPPLGIPVTSGLNPYRPNR